MKLRATATTLTTAARDEKSRHHDSSSYSSSFLSASKTSNGGGGETGDSRQDTNVDTITKENQELRFRNTIEQESDQIPGFQPPRRSKGSTTDSFVGDATMKFLEKAMFRKGTSCFGNTGEFPHGSEEDAEPDHVEDSDDSVLESLRGNENDESLEDPPDEMRKDRIEDILKFIAAMVVSFCICVLPWLLVEHKVRNTNHTITDPQNFTFCSWRRSTGILDSDNNCPYVGLTNVDAQRNLCLSWNYTSTQPEFEELPSLEKEKIKKLLALKIYPDPAIFCRRLHFDDPIQCLTLDKNANNKLALSSCAVPPCEMDKSYNCEKKKMDKLLMGPEWKAPKDPIKELSALNCLHDTGAITKKCWYNGNVDFVAVGELNYPCVAWGSITKLTKEQLGNELDTFGEIQENVQRAIQAKFMKGSDKYCRNIPAKADGAKFRGPFCFVKVDNNPRSPEQTHYAYPCLVPICPTEINRKCFHDVS